MIHSHPLSLTRSYTDYKVKQVPDILTISNDEFKKRFNREKPTPNTEIIFHCKIGMRSQSAADACKQLGFNK
jgi:rhodanese-related sulfurtransferase